MNEEQSKKNLSEDLINSTERPPYYCLSGIELKDAWRAMASYEELCGFYRLIIMKYLWRNGKKDMLIKDLRKMRNYLNWYIELVEEHEKITNDNKN